MENRFKPGDYVFYRIKKENLIRDIRAEIVGEKFNGGKGGFYDIRFLSNGREKTVHTSCLQPG